MELGVNQDKADQFSQTKLASIFADEGTTLAGSQLQQQTLTLKLSPIDTPKKNQLILKLKNIDPDLVERRFETVGPVLGRELIIKTISAVVLATGLIAIYLGIRFSSAQYGISAALATIHDAVVVLGVFSLLGHFVGREVDILFVTALLTILSFSVHDTIVVYDRIRERVRQRVNLDFEGIVNQAAMETLNRSLRNSLAIIFMLLIVFLLSTGSLQWFVLALLVGTITGTYSSTCVALPLLILWERLKLRWVKK